MCPGMHAVPSHKKPRIDQFYPKGGRSAAAAAAAALHVTTGDAAEEATPANVGLARSPAQVRLFPSFVQRYCALF